MELNNVLKKVWWTIPGFTVFYLVVKFYIFIQFIIFIFCISTTIQIFLNFIIEFIIIFFYIIFFIFLIYRKSDKDILGFFQDNKHFLVFNITDWSLIFSYRILRDNVLILIVPPLKYRNYPKHLWLNNSSLWSLKI